MVVTTLAPGSLFALLAGGSSLSPSSVVGGLFRLRRLSLSSSAVSSAQE